MTIELTLKRGKSSQRSTIGELSCNGALQCFTLEDVVREVKIPRETAIPAGRYRVIFNFSNRFKKVMPLLVNVPDFEGVRIHPGNTDADTDGCILVGTTKSADFIGNSRVAYDELMAKLEPAFNAGQDIFITIMNASE